MNKVLLGALVTVLTSNVFADGDVLRTNDNIVSKSSLSSVKDITPVKSLNSNLLLKNRFKKVSARNRLNLSKLNRFNRLNRFNSFNNRLSFNKFNRLNKLRLNRLNRLNLNRSLRGNTLRNNSLRHNVLRVNSLSSRLRGNSLSNVSNSSLSIVNTLSDSKNVISTSTLSSSTLKPSISDTSISINNTSVSSTNVSNLSTVRKSEIHDVTKPVSNDLAYSLMLQDNVKVVRDYINGKGDGKFKTDITLYKNPKYAALTQLTNKIEEYLHPKKK